MIPRIVIMAKKKMRTIQCTGKIKRRTGSTIAWIKASQG
jgi:hypothetical protein